MYGIFTYIYHEKQPHVGKYTIHGSYGWTCWFIAAASDGFGILWFAESYVCICLPRIRKSAKPLAFRWYCPVKPEHKTKQDQFGTVFLWKLIEMSTKPKTHLFSFQKIIRVVHQNIHQEIKHKRTQHTQLITQPPFFKVFQFNHLQKIQHSSRSPGGRGEGQGTRASYNIFPLDNFSKALDLDLWVTGTKVGAHNQL